MLKKSKDTQFRIEHICGDDKLVEFYTQDLDVMRFC